MLDGRADAGAIGSPFWKTVRAERLVPEGALTEIWTSPPYNHCMFTSRPDLDLSLERRFAEALSGMNYDNPTHRAVLDAEGLHHWVEPHLDGYTALREACVRQGFFHKRGGEVGCRVGRAPSLVLRAVEDRRQAMGVRTFALPGATRRGESVGERKNVAGDQEVLILGAHRMPIHAVGRDGDFRHQIGARKRDALFRKTTQRDATDHAILVR